MPLTYLSYLKVPELLDLQRHQSSPVEHDEMLFIIIHQTYELWFKQILHEFGLLKQLLSSGETWTSVKTMRRVLTIMKTLVAQIDILETMTPLSFNNFRGFLDNSSGFQSVQFRELEIMLGLRYGMMTSLHDPESEAFKTLTRRMQEETLWESFLRFLQMKGHAVPNARRVNEHGLIFEPDEQTQEILIDVMRNDPETAIMCELMVDFDEGLQEWRYRHVKMVERTIGTKKGTGGSDGVEYLKRTLFHSVFPDLWAIRAKL